MVSIIRALHSTPAAVLSDPHPEVDTFAKWNICNNVKNGFVWKIGSLIENNHTCVDFTIHQVNILIGGQQSS